MESMAVSDAAAGKCNEEKCVESRSIHDKVSETPPLSLDRRSVTGCTTASSNGNPEASLHASRTLVSVDTHRDLVATWDLSKKSFAETKTNVYTKFSGRVEVVWTEQADYWRTSVTR